MCLYSLSILRLLKAGRLLFPFAFKYSYTEERHAKPDFNALRYNIGVGTKFALGGPLSVMPSVGLHHCYTQHMQMHSTCACWYSIVLVVNVRAMYSY